MNNDIYLIGGVGGDGITLKYVVDKVELSDKSKDLNIYIHSEGGSVYEGLAIYNYLKSLEQEVHTISSGLVASIASIFFLAGNKSTRKVNTTDSFLIHLPMGGVQGNAIDFEKTARKLRDIEDKLSNIYASETYITKDEALDLMGKNEMLDVGFLKEKGFVSEVIEFKAVASLDFNVNINKNESKMKGINQDLKKEDVEGMFAKLEQTFKNFFKNEATNKVVQDVNGVEIDFNNLAKEDIPQEGDEATIEGKPATGDRFITAYNSMFTFEKGKVTAVKEKEIQDEKLTSALQEVKDLTAKLEASSLLVSDKEKEIETVTNSFKEVETEFVALKNTITSSYSPEAKVEGKNEESGKKQRII